KIPKSLPYQADLPVFLGKPRNRRKPALIPKCNTPTLMKLKTNKWSGSGNK
ncbi:hypothetical protein LINPERHAP1_LOCUS6616, partial [Linum perenne]